MKPLKLILEGPNLSGKTSILEALEKKFPDSFVVTIHGYYRPSLRTRFKTNQALTHYLKKRLLSLSKIFEEFQAEEILFNRLHLTDIVYCHQFLNINQNYQNFEKSLNRCGTGLILLDINDQAIKKRLRKRAQKGKTGAWDQDFQSIIQKRDAYRKAFNKSLIKRKVKIDTSNTTPKQAAGKIIEWWQRITSK